MEEGRSAEEKDSLEAMNAHLDRMSEHAELQTEFFSTISEQMQQQSKQTVLQIAWQLIGFQQQGFLAMLSGLLAGLSITVVLGVWLLNQLSGWLHIMMVIYLIGSTGLLLNWIFGTYGRSQSVARLANQTAEEMLSRELPEDVLEHLRERLKSDSAQKKNWLRRVLGR